MQDFLSMSSSLRVTVTSVPGVLRQSQLAEATMEGNVRIQRTKAEKGIWAEAKGVKGFYSRSMASSYCTDPETQVPVHSSEQTTHRGNTRRRN